MNEKLQLVIDVDNLDEMLGAYSHSIVTALKDISIELDRLTRTVKGCQEA